MPTRPMCTIPACDNPDHYACRLRAKGTQVSPRAQSTRTQNWRPTPFKPPSYNKQIMYDERPGGIKMPILNPDGSLVRRKQFDEHKSEITNNMRRIRTAPGD